MVQLSPTCIGVFGIVRIMHVCHIAATKKVYSFVQSNVISKCCDVKNEYTIIKNIIALTGNATREIEYIC